MGMHQGNFAAVSRAPMGGQFPVDSLATLLPQTIIFSVLAFIASTSIGYSSQKSRTQYLSMVGVI